MITPLRLDETALLATYVGLLRAGFCVVELVAIEGGVLTSENFTSVVAFLFNLSVDFSGTTILVVFWDDGSLGGMLGPQSVDFLSIGGSGVLGAILGA